MERQATVWQKITLITHLTNALYISRIYKELSKCNRKKANNQKTGKILKQKLYQRGYIDGR